MENEATLILSADNWSLIDEKTGKPLAGISIWAVSNYRDPTDQSVGLKPVKMAAPKEIWPSLAAMKFPAMCELNTGIAPGAGGKAAVVVKGIKYLRAVDLFGVSKAKA